MVDQKLPQLADFPLLCAHSGKFWQKYSSYLGTGGPSAQTSTNRESVSRPSTRFIHPATIAVQNVLSAVKPVQPEDEPNDRQSAQKAN